jgi:hypothetical protein
METNPNAVRSAPCAISLEQLSDDELLSGTRRLVGRSNQLLASLVAHLGEVEARGIHRTRACSSLYTYCIYELRFSEDEAFRRVAAARLVRRFPALLDALASGELQRSFGWFASSTRCPPFLLVSNRSARRQRRWRHWRGSSRLRRAGNSSFKRRAQYGSSRRASGRVTGRRWRMCTTQVLLMITEEQSCGAE